MELKKGKIIKTLKALLKNRTVYTVSVVNDEIKIKIITKTLDN